MYDQEPEQIYEVACNLVERGISVIPTGGGISPKAKQPHHQALKATGHSYLDGAGKVRSTWKALQQRLPTAEELEAWFLEERARGLGYVTGQLSGYVVVDVDTEGLPLLEQLGWRPHIITPSGGQHFYVKHPSWRVSNNASKAAATLPPGFDVRGDGGYAMFAPSRNRQGQYRRTEHRRPLSIADIPEVVSVNGSEYALRKALGLCQPLDPGVEPQETMQAHHRAYDDQVPVWLILERAAEYARESRNKSAFMFGLFMHANNYQLSTALAHAEEHFRLVQSYREGAFTLEEVITSIKSAYRYPKNDPWKRGDASAN